MRYSCPSVSSLLSSPVLSVCWIGLKLNELNKDKSALQHFNNTHKAASKNVLIGSFPVLTLSGNMRVLVTEPTGVELCFELQQASVIKDLTKKIHQETGVAADAVRLLVCQPLL